MKAHPTVTVVIPAFNCEAYIVETLKSVFAQTYAATEVIVVDDGSSDQTRERVSEFRGRVQYVRQENAGVSRARNRGIACAKGEYIAFLDADDIWLPDKLMKQVAMLSAEKNKECVHTNYALLLISSSGWTESPAKWEPARKNYLSEFIHGRRFRMSSLLVSKKCIDDIGGFDEKIPGRYSEDLDLFLRISEKVRIGYIGDPLVLYRRHGNSTTATGHARELAVCDLYVFEAALKRCPERWKSLVKSDRNALFDMAFFAGWSCMMDGSLHSARQYFVRALKFRPYSAVCRVYYAASFFPARLIRNLRVLKEHVMRPLSGG